MKIWFAALMGLVQGITEFLPVSSSGHLSVLQNLFGMENIEEGHLLFDVLLHLATLVSICIVYWQDIKDMVTEFFGFFRDLRHPKPEEGNPKPARRMVFMIIIALAPLLVAYPFLDSIEKLYYNTLFIGFAFLVTGAILYAADRMKTGHKTAANMTVKDSLIIGACQAVATIPGISRSGSTITAGMAVGLDRTYAVKFSFLLSLPAILGANIISLFKALGEGIDFSLLPAYLVGMIVAGVSGYFSIKLVKILSQQGKFGKFCYYCFGAGIVTIILFFAL
jgi:undecaprenyl-diphosphatase